MTEKRTDGRERDGISDARARAPVAVGSSPPERAGRWERASVIQGQSGGAREHQVTWNFASVASPNRSRGDTDPEQQHRARAGEPGCP